jgi:hypothetical protein
MSSEIPRPTLAGSRRTFLSVAAGALATGLAVAWWRQRREALPETALTALWAAEFEQPDGSPLSLASFKGQPLVINFWATWCTPCVEEMPLLNAFYQQNKSKSWQVLGLAIDQPSAVKRFLGQHPVEYPIGLAGLTGTALMTELGNLQGGLPFTLVIDAQQGLRMRKLGKLSEDDIRSWV